MSKVTIVLILSILSVFNQMKCMTLNDKEENCVNELQLDRSTIETWNIQPLLPEDNEEIKQYLACYWKKLGYLEENGDLNYMKLSEVVHSDLKNRIRSDCLTAGMLEIPMSKISYDNNKRNQIITMKIIAVLGFAFVLSQVEGRSVESSASNQVTLSPLQEQCVNELKLSDKKEDLSHINSRAICPEDNPEFNKFISCFWKKTGRQNENGEINFDTLRSFIHEGIVQAIGEDPVGQSFAEQHSSKIINECKTIQDSNPEKLVAKVRNCIVRGLETADQQ
ncbi:hypothetical protein ILUMI_24601 [Ignelater luminosus]|uniref:Uncharacterized protein n=1 Tax=Ignelater luminosus TaxID=2038154 RepID=A0A8K0G0H3_IGNLU|nr:hypothetical protein ILUMI_24601 [Ignelater luminosus]